MSSARELVREVLPEPGRLWIRYLPRRWPAPEEALWIDLGTSNLGSPGGGAMAAEECLRALEGVPLDDVLYFPPVPRPLAAARDRLARAHVNRGTPVVAQCRPGDPPPAAGVVVALDLLPVALGDGGPVGPLLEEKGSPGDQEAFGSRVALWPLIPGRGLATEREGLAAALVEARISSVLSLPLELPPRERRRLAQELVDEETGLALFHSAPPSPLAAARSAVEQGFSPWSPRALPRPPLRGAGNLRLAAALAVAGELSLLRRDPPSRSQGFLRAARWAEHCPHDLEAVIREGNVSVLHWLEEEPRRVLMAASGRQQEEVLEELVAAGLAVDEAPSGPVTAGGDGR